MTEDQDSDRKRIEDELRRLSVIVCQSPVAVMITDTDGRIEYVNPKFVALTGYSPEEAIGRTPRILKSGVHPPEFYRNMWDTLRAGREWTGEIRNRKKNGDLYWEHNNMAPVRDTAGVITHFVAVKEDVTEHKVAAEELQRAREAADAANRAKTAYLANMSHEIRTPMNAILGFSQLMLRDASLSATHRQHLETITRSGEHLLNLINDILEMAKIESGHISVNRSPLDLHALLDDLTMMFRFRTDVKGLKFTLERAPDVPRYVLTDGGKLRQILVNLIGNAISSPRKGRCPCVCSLENRASKAFGWLARSRIPVPASPRPTWTGCSLLSNRR
jgi:PAS domain S-box-containing protein